MNIEVKLNSLSKSQGSCELSQYGCKILTSVHGPLPVTASKQSLTYFSYLKVFINFPSSFSSSLSSTSHNSSKIQTITKSLELLVKQLLGQICDLEKFSNTKLIISSLILKVKKFCLKELKACLINTIILALFDAEIPLLCFPVAFGDLNNFFVTVPGRENEMINNTDEKEKKTDFLIIEFGVKNEISEENYSQKVENKINLIIEESKNILNEFKKQLLTQETSSS